jgi:L-alanine-DL-glutamate epimerase-like enolase superfamily enzyme
MMRIRHIMRYALPFREPVGGLEVREGVVVGAEDDSGNRYVGEAAPLPPFTSETVEDVEASLSELKGERLSWLGDPVGFVEEQKRTSWMSSVSAALETLHLSALLLRSSARLTRHERDVRVYGLATSPEHAGELAKRGFRSLKVKLPASIAEGIIASLESYRDAVPDHVDFRVDANQSWSFATAKRVIVAAKELGVVAIEEPLAQPTSDRLKALGGLADVPIFADESVRSASDLEQWSSSFDGVVLKPMFIGGPLATLDLCRRADRAGMLTYVTTALDAAVGRRMAGWTAQMLPARSELPHGLLTGGLLAEDIGPDVEFTDDRIPAGTLSDWRGFAEEVWRQCF